MKRYGATISLWQDTVANFTATSANAFETTFDVLIASGVTTALLLQKEGKKCVIAEAHNLV